MKRFKVKFFGAKQERHEQVRRIQTVIEAQDISEVENLLREEWSVVNSLKIREIKEGV